MKILFKQLAKWIGIEYLPTPLNQRTAFCNAFSLIYGLHQIFSEISRFRD